MPLPAYYRGSRNNSELQSKNPHYYNRLEDALIRLRGGEPDEDIRERHGMIVLREAKNIIREMAQRQTEEAEESDEQDQENDEPEYAFTKPRRRAR